MFQVGMKFVVKLVSGITGSIAERTAALDHELLNNPMKGESIVKTFVGKFLEVRTCIRRFIVEEFQFDVPMDRGNDGCFHTVMATGERKNTEREIL